MRSNNRKLRTLASFTIALFVLLFGVLSVSAVDCGFRNITSNSRLSKSTIINVTFDNQTNNVSIGIAIYAYSALTINSSATTLIENSTNNSRFGAKHVSMVMNDSIHLVDESETGYTLACECIDSVSVTACNSTLTGISLDRSKPIATGISSPGNSTSASIYTANFGYTNATRWRFVHNGIVEQSKTVTGSFSNTSDSRIISLRDKGSYYVEVSDGLNVTNSSIVSYLLEGGLIKSSVKEPAQIIKKKIIMEKKKAEVKSKKGLLLFGGVVVIIILFAGLMMNPKVRRKRRR